MHHCPCVLGPAKPCVGSWASAPAYLSIPLLSYLPYLLPTPCCPHPAPAPSPQVQRNQSTKVFAIFVFIVMWALSVFFVVHAVWVIVFRPDPDIPYDVPAYSGEAAGGSVHVRERGRAMAPREPVSTSVNPYIPCARCRTEEPRPRSPPLPLPPPLPAATLLFALPAVRAVQPGVPDVGAVIDVVGFFWNMALLALTSCWLLAAIYVRGRARRRQQQGQEHGQGHYSISMAAATAEPEGAHAWSV